MNQANRLVIAITGGIASGKSTVASCFEKLGVAVYDADQAAREVIRPGSEALAQIIHTFGRDVITAGGTLDRAMLRRRIFNDAEARHKLEAIIHPRVRSWLQQHAWRDPSPYCLLTIPLLVEHLEDYRWVDRILLVDVDETTQLERLLQRDHIDSALARDMLASQASRQDRLAVADDIIHNSGHIPALEPEVERLHTHYLALAKQR